MDEGADAGARGVRGGGVPGGGRRVGELFAVKSVGAAGAAALRREQG